MASRFFQVLAALLFLCALYSQVLGNGTVVLNTVVPASTGVSNVRFYDAVFSPSATITNIQSNAFALLQQFELNLNVPTISLNAGTGGLSLSGSLGASINSASTLFSASQNFVSTSDTLSVSSPNVILTSTAGNIQTTAGEKLNFNTLGTTILNGNLAATFQSTGGIDIRSFGDRVTFTSDSASFTHGTDVRLNTDVGNVNVAGQSVTISGRLINLESNHDNALYSDNDITFSLTTASFSGENLDFSAIKGLTIRSSASMSVTAAQVLDFHGNSATLSSNALLTIQSTAGNGGISIVSGGVNIASTSNTVSFSTTNNAGSVGIDSTTSVAISSGVVALTVSQNLFVGGVDTVSTTISGSPVTLSGVTINSDSVTTAVNSPTISLQSGSLNFNAGHLLSAAAGTISLVAPTVSLTTGPQYGQTLSFVSGNTNLVSPAFTFVGDRNANIIGTTLTSITTDKATFSSSSGRDISLASAAVVLQATNAYTITAASSTARSVNDITISASTYQSTSPYASFVSSGALTFTSTGAIAFSNTAGSMDISTVPALGTTSAITLSSSTSNVILQTTTGPGISINAHRGTFVASDSWSFTAGKVFTLSTDTSQSLSTSLFTMTATTQVTAAASNINYNFRSFRIPAGLVRIGAGRNVNFAARNDIELTSTNSVNLNAVGGVIGRSGGQMSFSATTSIGLLANNDIRLESQQDITAQTVGTLEVDSTGDVSMGSGRDFLSTGSLILNSDLGLNITAGRNALVSADDTLTVTASTFNAQSGNAQNVQLSSAAGTVISAATEVPKQVTFSGQATRVTSNGPMTIAGATVTLGATDIIVAADTDALFSGTTDAVVTTKALSFTGTNLVDFSGATQVLFQSGVDRFINGTFANGIVFNAKQNIDVSAASDINFFATENFLLQAGTDIVLAADSKLEVNVNRTISLFSNKQSLANSINVNSGGAVTITSSKLFNIAASTGADFTATAANEVAFVSDGANSGGCGIDLQVGTGSTTTFTATTSWGVIHGREGVNVVASASSSAVGGDIQFTSTKDAFFHSEDGAVLITATGQSVRGNSDAILISSTQAAGDISISAIQASVVNFGKGISVSAAGSTSISSGEGIDILATGGNIGFQTVDLLIDGARALNISGGAVTPPSAGALSFTSTGAVTAQAGSEIRLSSKGTVGNALGNGLSVSGATILLKTSNGFDLQANAARAVTFTATNTDFSMVSTGGDVKVDSNAGDLSITSVGVTSITAPNGPVIINGGGVNGFVTFQSNNNAWTTTSTGANVQIRANNDAKLSATNAINIQATSSVSGAGRTLISTVRPVDDIIINTKDLTATASGTRTTPQDILQVWGNNIDMFATTSISFAANNGFMYIGNATSPAIAITAVAVTLNSNDGLYISSERQVNVGATGNAVFSGANGLRVTSTESIQLSTANTASPLTFTAKGIVAFTAKTALVQAQGDIPVTGGTGVTFQSTGQNPGDGLFFDSQTTITTKGNTAVQFAGAVLDATTEVQQITFTTDNFVVLNPLTTTTQDNVDPGYVTFVSGTTTDFLSTGSLAISSSKFNGSLSFVTTKSPADISLSGSPNVALTTQAPASNIVFNANQLLLSANTGATFTSTDPLGLHRANITMRADGNIVSTSNTDKVIFQIDAGGAVFQAVDRNSQLVLQAPAGQKVTVTAQRNITLATHPESLADLNVKTTSNGGIILKSTSSLVQLQSGRLLSFTSQADVQQDDLTWAVDAQRGVDFLLNAAGTLSLLASAQNMLFQTNSSNSDVVFQSTASGTMELTVTGTGPINAQSTLGLTTQSTGGPVSVQAATSFTASATGYTSVTSKTDVTLKAAQNVAITATGYNQATDAAVSVLTPGGTTTYSAQLAFLVQATEEVAFTQTTSGGSFSLASGGNPVVFGAQGNDGRVLMRSTGGAVSVTASGGLDFSAGNDLNVSGGSGGIVAGATSVTLTTNSPGSAITIENDDVATGTVTLTSPATFTAISTSLIVQADQDASTLLSVKATGASMQFTASNAVTLEDDRGGVTFTTTAGAAMTLDATTGIFSAAAADVTITGGAISVTSPTIEFHSSQGTVSFLNTGAVTTIDATSIITTGVSYGSNIQFSAGTVSINFPNAVFTTLQDQGEIFVHATGGTLSLFGNGAISLVANGGVQFITEHGPSATQADIAIFSLSTVTLSTWGLSDQIDGDSDSFVQIESPSVAATNYQSTLGFFSKTPSPLHVVSRWSQDLCVARPGNSYCAYGTGYNSGTNYAQVISGLDGILSTIRNALLAYGLFDYVDYTTVINP